LWYGRTTWWKLLVYSRKLFVVSNAIIGVYTILSITGFSFENIVTGIYVIGHTYLENFTAIIHKLFGWLLNLLNGMVPKVPDIPTPPIEPPVEPSYPDERQYPPYDYPRPHKRIPWFDDPKPANEYTLPEYVGFNLPSSDWNLSSWLWYGGIAILTIGALYLLWFN
jgi:hypothetical protein